jgi:hypothetical protein
VTEKSKSSRKRKLQQQINNRKSNSHQEMQKKNRKGKSAKRNRVARVFLVQTNQKIYQNGNLKNQTAMT